MEITRNDWKYWKYAKNIKLNRFPEYKSFQDMQWTSCKAILKKSHCTYEGTPLQGSHHCHPEKITSYMWGDPITRSPSLTVTRFPHSNHIIMWGTPFQSSHIPYKVWWTIRVIDSYKVPAVDLNHEELHTDSYKVTVVVCPCPQGLGALIVMCIGIFKHHRIL